MLSLKLKGHYNYFAVRCNMAQLQRMHCLVQRAWFYWLNRRRRHPDYNWDEFRQLLNTFALPKPRIIHSNI